jgi:hypothetical protein
MGDLRDRIRMLLWSGYVDNEALRIWNVSFAIALAIALLRWSFLWIVQLLPDRRCEPQTSAMFLRVHFVNGTYHFVAVKELGNRKDVRNAKCLSID